MSSNAPKRAPLPTLPPERRLPPKFSTPFFYFLDTYPPHAALALEIWRHGADRLTPCAWCSIPRVLAVLPFPCCVVDPNKDGYCANMTWILGPMKFGEERTPEAVLHEVFKSMKEEDRASGMEREVMRRVVMTLIGLFLAEHAKDMVVWEHKTAFFNAVFGTGYDWWDLQDEYGSASPYAIRIEDDGMDVNEQAGGDMEMDGLSEGVKGIEIVERDEEDVPPNDTRQGGSRMLTLRAYTGFEGQMTPKTSLLVRADYSEFVEGIYSAA